MFLGEVDAAIRLLYAKALRQGANALALWKTLLYEAPAWKEAMQAFDPALWSVGGLRPTDASPDADADGQEPGGARPEPRPPLEQALVEMREAFWAAERRAQRATVAMRKALWAAHGAEKGLVASALLRRDQLLAHPQLLAPHFALYLNFLQQLQYARQRLNGLTGKHLDFYYGTILEESPQPPVNDSIYFAVQSDPKVGAFTVPAGARLAGQDAAGQAMLYQTDAELELSGMALAQIATVYVGQLPAQMADNPALTGFYLGEVAQPAVVKGALAPAAAWAAFGEEPAGGVAAGPVTVTPATIGFALASPYLHLEEGTRTIDLSVLFDVPLAVSPPLIPLPPNTFQISYSGLTDWVALDPKKCHASTEAGVLPPAKEPASFLSLRSLMAKPRAHGRGSPPPRAPRQHPGAEQSSISRQLMRQQRQRIGEAGPAEGLAVEDQQVDRIALAGQTRHQSADSGYADRSREVARPKPEIEARMLEPRKPATLNGPSRLRPSGNRNSARPAASKPMTTNGTMPLRAPTWRCQAARRSKR